jgi:hypothetical protein
MGNRDMALELEKMRAELAALKQSRSNLASQADANATAAIATVELEETMVEAEETDVIIKNQFEELTDLLKEEIGELPTITTIVVFSLGILMGRLMR